MEKTRRPKDEVPKWTRVIDLRWMHGAISRTLSTKYLGGKRRVKVLNSQSVESLSGSRSLIVKEDENR
jgi:hypothetical protein